jgi:hypothetical protein
MSLFLKYNTLKAEETVLASGAKELAFQNR